MNQHARVMLYLKTTKTTESLFPQLKLVACQQQQQKKNVNCTLILCPYLFYNSKSDTFSLFQLQFSTECIKLTVGLTSQRDDGGKSLTQV